MAVVDGLLDGTAGFVGVGAGGETAVSRESQHLWEVECDFLFFKVNKAEAS